MVRFFVFLFFLSFLTYCGHNKTRVPAGHFSSVTVETSGDIYSEEGGANSQIDLFGNCLPGQSVVYIEIDRKMMAANCRKGHYILSVNLPKSFIKKTLKTKKERSPSSAERLKKRVSVFHRDQKDSRVTSFLVIDPLKKEATFIKDKR